MTEISSVSSRIEDVSDADPAVRRALRENRAREKAAFRLKEEREAELARLAARPDVSPELEPFLKLLGADNSPKALAERVGRQVVAMLCLQAPLELFEAAGLQPLRLLSGSIVGASCAPPGLPALMCPPMRALMGEISADPELARLNWIIPTTCDWASGMDSLKERCFGDMGEVKIIDLPRRKENPAARRRWLEEIAELWQYLQKLSGARKNRRHLLQAVQVMEEARKALGQLISLRREGRVPAVWFFAAVQAFYCVEAVKWTEAVRSACRHFASLEVRPKIGVFLTGSPVVFPNFKFLHLLDEAEFDVLGDDMCSGERFLCRHAALKDPSERGILEALAETSHDGCLCPVFVENKRRLAPIMEAVSGVEAKAVIFHLLKGCHPYEMDSVVLDKSLHDLDMRFFRLETDYGQEDDRNLLTRLEALRSSIS